MQEFKHIFIRMVNHKNAPIVFTTISCVGVVGTGILAARAAPKARRALEELRELDDEGRGRDHIPIREAVKHTWKFYIPPVCMGLVTISSIIASDRVHAKRAAIFSTSAALAANTLREYQQHILEEIGAEKESKVRDKIAKNKLARAEPLPEVDHDIFMATGDGILVCYDSLSGRYFKSNVDAIRAIENDINRQILSNMNASLNDLYYLMGLDPVEVGYILGFNVDNMIDFHFSAQLDPNNKPVLVIGYINMPVPDYDK